MQFYNYGNKKNPKFILFHGGFLGKWSLTPLINQLEKKFFVIVPELDGHGTDTQTTFISITDCADKVIRYLKNSSITNIKVIAGFSVGAQIASEILMKKPTIAEYAVIESGCESSIPVPKIVVKALIKWKQGAYYKKFLNSICPLPNHFHQQFVENFYSMSFDSLVNTCYSNFSHKADSRLKFCSAKTLIIYGGNEPLIMKNSALRLSKLIPKNTLFSISSLKHGGLSIWNPETYLLLVSQLSVINFDSK